MKTLLFFIIPLALGGAVFAQTNRSYKVNPGEKVTKVIPVDALYEYPEFQAGTVQFKNGKFGMARMNFNHLLKEMEFIDEKLDTTALGDAGSTKFIVIGKDSFYFDKVYVKLISNKNQVRLAESTILLLSNRQKIGAFGEINGGSVEVKEQVSSNANMLKTLVAKEILTFTENRIFYFGDRFGHFKQANRKNVLDMFAKTKPGLEKFLDENKLDYFNESDITRLTAFLQE